ncbi:MAG: hypothetical protein IT179_22595 [Acidobacteria bacterium]|nr:hypothetical protein [Acidobacteriota bacterium]
MPTSRNSVAGGPTTGAAIADDAMVFRAGALAWAVWPRSASRRRADGPGA